MNRFKSPLWMFLLLLNSYCFAQSQIKYLSGTGAENTQSWDFYCSDGMNSKKWTKIQVPSCWEQQGFGEYNYGHVPLNKRLNEEGHYKYEFTADASWKQKNIQLFFEGVFTDCEVLLNGKSVGSHQGAFYEFNFDVSALLNYGEKNLLEVKVKKLSENKSVNQAELEADFWNFGGIFRPVYLQINPAEYIEHLAIDARADGTINTDVSLSQLKNAASVQLSVTDFKGKLLSTVNKPLAGKSANFRISHKVLNPKLWSAEFPNRYFASYTLLDKSGKVLHKKTEKIGFRTVEVRAQDGIYVNGTKIKLKGVTAAVG